MDTLLAKYNDYMRLVNCKVTYKLADGSSIAFKYREENFLHLLGLHKLQDIQLIQFWTDRSNCTVKLKDVIRKIRKGDLTDADVRSSVFFKKIEDRYEYFNYDNLTTLIYTDAIIDFDAHSIGSVLKGDYLLFEERPDGEYNHMSIAMDEMGERYVESFFHQNTNNYLKGQKIVKIVKFAIYDADGNLVVEDRF